MSSPDSTCSNGLVGIENGEVTVCCDSDCGQCGGAGCGDVSGLSVDDCCADTIEDNGQLCSETGSAPCVLDAPDTSADGTCSNGVKGIESEDKTVCCDSRCEECGGLGCDDIAGLSGEDCCTDDIEMKNEICSDKRSAPCVMDDDPVMITDTMNSDTSSTVAPDTITSDTSATTAPDTVPTDASATKAPDTMTSDTTMAPDTMTSDRSATTAPDTMTSDMLTSATMAPDTMTSDTSATMAPDTITADTPTCSNGLAGVEDGDSIACCDPACGVCGGSSCGSNPGLTSADCCVGTIVENGQSCDATGTAPCILDVEEQEVAASTCSNGFAGYEDSGGKVCCAVECGQCGGVGCGSIEGTNGDTDCCSSTIQLSGAECGNGVEAPCIIGNSTAPPTAAPPTATPSVTFAPTPGSRGGLFSATPTVFGATRAPAAGSRGIDSGSGTASPSFLTSSMAPTVSPRTVASGASMASAGSIVPLAAMVGAMFAMFVGARK